MKGTSTKPKGDTSKAKSRVSLDSKFLAQGLSCLFQCFFKCSTEKSARYLYQYIMSQQQPIKKAKGEDEEIFHKVQENLCVV